MAILYVMREIMSKVQMLVAECDNCSEQEDIIGSSLVLPSGWIRIEDFDRKYIDVGLDPVVYNKISTYCSKACEKQGRDL